MKDELCAVKQCAIKTWGCLYLHRTGAAIKTYCQCVAGPLRAASAKLFQVLKPLNIFKI